MRLRGHIACTAQKKLVQNFDNVTLKERERGRMRENAKIN
jgi:hypothetical protein